MGVCRKKGQIIQVDFSIYDGSGFSPRKQLEQASSINFAEAPHGKSVLIRCASDRRPGGGV